MDNNNEQEQRDAIAESYANQSSETKTADTDLSPQENLPEFLTTTFDQMAVGLVTRRAKLMQEIAAKQAELRIVAADLFMVEQCKAATKMDAALFTGERKPIVKEEFDPAKPKTGFGGRRPGMDPRRSALIGSDNQKQSPQNQPPQ